MRVLHLHIVLAAPDDVEVATILARLREAWPSLELQPPGKQRRRLSRDLVCHQCGETFIATRTDALYCSAACRQNAHASGVPIRSIRRRAPSSEPV